MTVLLINPNLVFQRDDPFTTGIVYMPIGLAYLAASLRREEVVTQVIDSFGEEPKQAASAGKFIRLGLSDEDVLERISAEVSSIIIYAINNTNHIALTSLVSAIKSAKPDIPLIILENTQAVTAYSLEQVADEFFDAGADYLLTGEADHTGVTLAKLFIDGKPELVVDIPGVISRHGMKTGKDFLTEEQLNILPWPAWDMFPLDNYWGLGYAHGPLSSDRYLPLLTSRGCPYPCRFCVVPSTNSQKWRPRSPNNVVDEIEYYINNFGVREFHIEDLDPTISDGRIREICQLIIDRRLDVNWKISAGTKVETIKDEETIDLMAKAGCTYISISPETGSPDLLKAMRKPFDLEHAVKLVQRMNKVGIRSQACFVLGFPGEVDEDLNLTREMVRNLTRQGVDEIALFIITPVPGSAIFDEYEGYDSISDLNFSPTWRTDYSRLNSFRMRLYRDFLIWKMIYHPLKLIRQPINFLLRRFETKMEMVPYRAMILKKLSLSVKGRKS